MFIKKIIQFGLIAFCFLSISPMLFAQMTVEERTKLVKLSKDLNQKYLIKQATLVREAAKLKIPLQIKSDNSLLVLRDIVNGNPIYDGIDNINAVRTISAREVQVNGTLDLDLTGAGQTLGLWEAFEAAGGAMVRTTHDEFDGRVTLQDAGTFSSHGTHVAGTMIASGVDPAAMGFSTGANLLSFDISNDVAEMATQAADPTTPIRVSNHSYGSRSGWAWDNTAMMWRWWGNAGDAQDWKFGAYNDQAEDWDEVAFDAPFYLIVKSAGNDRDDAGPGNGGAHFHGNGNTVFNDNHNTDGQFDCIPTYGNAKNILTVGAVLDLPGGYATAAGVTTTDFSGYGPTDDGRIKPDVVANGNSLWSSDSAADDDYSNKSGTSMSTPSVSGAVGLLLEHWDNLYSGVPRATTMKALLIHTADECGSDPGPDYAFGWGLVNVAEAAQLMSRNEIFGCTHILSDEVDGSDTWTYTVESSGNVPLKATLVWADPPASNTNNGTVNPGASYLVNNLNLSITEGGDTFRPWVLNPASPNDAATRGVNNRDNVEQVLIDNPSAGTYTINVSFPGGLPLISQRFSLIITGNDATLENNTISNVSIIGPRTYTVRNELTFGPMVQIQSPGDVDAIAGRTIFLKPGFEVNSLGKFHGWLQQGGICAEPTTATKPMTFIQDKGNDLFEHTENRNFGQDISEKTILEDPSLAIIPNPASDHVHFHLHHLPYQSNITARISNNMGEVLFQKEIVATEAFGDYSIEVPISNLASGLYFVVIDGEDFILSEKLIVQH